MSEPRDLRDLLGDDVTPEEVEELRPIDALLRSVPGPPPEVPASLTQAVRASTVARRSWSRPRTATAVALAATTAAVFFGLGAWVAGGEDFEARAAVPMAATEHARGASGLIRIGERDESGNWGLELEVSGLPKLPEGGYYVLWLAKDGEYAATCGTFTVGDGETSVYMNASYRLKDYDAWVVTAHLPGQPQDADPPWLLRGEV